MELKILFLYNMAMLIVCGRDVLLLLWLYSKGPGLQHQISGFCTKCFYGTYTVNFQ